MNRLALVLLVAAAVALVSCGRETGTVAERDNTEVATAGGETSTCCEGGVCVVETSPGGECTCEGGECICEGGKCAGEGCVCVCPCGCKFQGEWVCEGGVCTKVLTCGCKCTASCTDMEAGKCKCECAFECPDACADGCRCGSS